MMFFMVYRVKQGFGKVLDLWNKIWEVLGFGLRIGF